MCILFLLVQCFIHLFFSGSLCVDDLSVILSLSYTYSPIFLIYALLCFLYSCSCNLFINLLQPPLFFISCFCCVFFGFVCLFLFSVKTYFKNQRGYQYCDAPVVPQLNELITDFLVWFSSSCCTVALFICWNYAQYKTEKGKLTLLCYTDKA